MILGSFSRRAAERISYSPREAKRKALATGGSGQHADPQNGKKKRLGIPKPRCTVIVTVSVHVAVNDLRDLIFGNGADDLVGNLAALKDQECGDAANVVAAG